MYEKHQAQLSELDAADAPRLNEVHAGTAAMAEWLRPPPRSGLP